MIGLIMFAVALLMLLYGFPVAFTFGGIALIFGLMADPEMFAFMPYRIMSIMENSTLMAVPLFIFMGIMLQKTKLAEQLLESMALLFGKVAGGVAISTIIVGTLLAASTGVVGASVVAMGVISLPVMLKYKYNKSLSCGVICASGTLGQIIPPSIILIILGDVLGIAVGDLFRAAVLPGLILVSAYILYVLIYSYLKKDGAPPIPLTNEQQQDRKKLYIDALKNILPPLLLIIVVLGSIFQGIATPTESSALGSVGAIFLALIYGKFSFKSLFDSAQETVKITSMVFAILLGATAFSMAFVYTGGDVIVEEYLLQLPGEKWGFLIFSMLFILILGFFIDFVEIAFIVVPILLPIAEALGIPLLWFAILIAMNLQTSFLTPPFGFSLFYLKGVAPPEIHTTDIYKGVMPFIAIQVAVLASILIFPAFYGLL